MAKEQIYNVAIIGGGPAGLTAALYASRANLSVIFIEKGAPGGKMVKTSKVENWSGTKSISGPDLSLNMFDHAQNFGAVYKYGVVQRVNSIAKSEKEIVLESGEKILTNSVVVATGMVENVPESVKGIHEFENHGVSYCAICDGPLFNKKPMAIIGGGNSAIEEGSYLASIASKIYVFVRGDKLVAEQKIVDELKSKSNVEIIFNSEVLEISGDKSLEKARVMVDGEEKEYQVNALFPYIGQSPVASFVNHFDIADESGFLVTNHSMETKEDNIFAIGDIRKKEIRQIVTAAADGAIVGKVLANRFS